MKLNQLRDNPGAKKIHTRLAGVPPRAWQDLGPRRQGAKARAGVSIHGFEGGQMPLYMRLPKRGFHNRFANDFAVINLGRIQTAIDAGKLRGKETLTEADLHAAGLISHGRNGVRLLAKGEFKTKLNFEVAGASRSAIAAVEKLGGSVRRVSRKSST